MLKTLTIIVIWAAALSWTIFVMLFQNWSHSFDIGLKQAQSLIELRETVTSQELNITAKLDDIQNSLAEMKDLVNKKQKK